MTDKEKFRKEVEKLKSNLIYGACSSQVTMETRCKEEAYDEVLAILDSLQEEPRAKFKVGQTIKKEGFNNGFTISKIEKGFYYNTCGDYFPVSAQDQWELTEKPVNEDLKECKGCNNFSRCNFCMNGEKWEHIEGPGSDELEKEIQNFFDGWMEDDEYNQAVKPNCYCAGLEDCRNIARHFANWQKQRDNIPQELVDAYWEFQKVANKNVRNYINIVNGYNKEPVSEDLEEAVNTYIGYPPEVDECSSVYGKRQAFKAGAKWQKQQDSIPSKDLAELIDTLSKRYPEVSFAKLSRIAVKVAKWQMAQMMKDATDVTVHVEAGNYPYIPQMELYNYDKDVSLAKKGDKYKVVLIKED